MIDPDLARAESQHLIILRSDIQCMKGDHYLIQEGDLHIDMADSISCCICLSLAS